MRALLRALIRGYQLLLSPWLRASCRYYPSCSQYAIEALDSHGILHGGILALRRLARCHPWHAGGYDPVPLKAQHLHDC
ncbi:MAG: membrane protein insertion efficiency factor YidD [Steroidobacteraceae bacterium]|jgi:putative membrane protein insertion efficiency factor